MPGDTARTATEPSLRLSPCASHLTEHRHGRRGLVRSRNRACAESSGGCSYSAVPGAKKPAPTPALGRLKQQDKKLGCTEAGEKSA